MQSALGLGMGRGLSKGIYKNQDTKRPENTTKINKKRREITKPIGPTTTTKVCQSQL